MYAQSCYWATGPTSGRQLERSLEPYTSSAAARTGLELEFGSGGQTSDLGSSERDPGSTPDILAALSASNPHALVDPAGHSQRRHVGSSAFASSGFGAPVAELGAVGVGVGRVGALGPEQDLGAVMMHDLRFLDSAPYEAASQYSTTSFSRLSSSSSSLPLSLSTPPQPQPAMPAPLSQPAPPTQAFQHSLPLASLSQSQAAFSSAASFCTRQPSVTQLQQHQQHSHMSVFTSSFSNISSLAQNSAYDLSALSRTPPAFASAISQQPAPVAQYCSPDLFANSNAPLHQQQQQQQAMGSQLAGSTLYPVPFQPSPSISLSSYTSSFSDGLRAHHSSSGFQAASRFSMGQPGALQLTEPWTQQQQSLYEPQQQFPPRARVLSDPLRLPTVFGSPDVTQPPAFNVSASPFVCTLTNWVHSRTCRVN